MMTIRAESPDDIAAIRHVNLRAFGAPGEADLVDRLRAARKAVVSLVAERDGQVVGHVLFSPVTVAIAPPGWRAVGLAPVSVQPECQRTGIGAALIRAGLEACRQSGYDAVVVLGHVGYYPRFGFVRASDRGLGNEYGATDAFMALELRPGALHDVSGLVTYASEFREVSRPASAPREHEATQRIRLAVPAEREALEALMRRASLQNPGDREAILANPDAIELPADQIADGHVIVVEDGGAIQGFAAILPRDDGDAELDALFVEPDTWRRGYGRALVDHGAAMARERHARALHVIGNTHAEAFYRACGFETTGRVATRFGDGLRMRLMVGATRESSLREWSFDSDGVRLFATEEGSGPTVVMLHGAMANHLAVRPFVAPLAGRHRVVTPDVRGNGKSWYGGPLSFDQLADDVARLLDHLGVERAVVGGVSSGSGVALRFALRYPARVTALLVVTPVYAGAEHGYTAAQRSTFAMMDALASRALDEGVQVLRPLYAALPDGIRERALAMMATFDAASVVATSHFLVSEHQPFDAAADLQALAGPTLLVHGDDPMHPAGVSELYAANLRDCTSVAANATDVAATIAAFVERRASSAA